MIFNRERKCNDTSKTTSISCLIQLKTIIFNQESRQSDRVNNFAWDWRLFDVHKYKSYRFSLNPPHVFSVVCTTVDQTRCVWPRHSSRVTRPRDERLLVHIRKSEVAMILPMCTSTHEKWIEGSKRIKEENSWDVVKCWSIMRNWRVLSSA